MLPLPNLKLIGLAAAGLAIVGLTISAYHYGKLSERDAVHRGIVKYQQREAELINQLEAAKHDREIIYRDRIKTVKVAADPTGCADTRMPDGILERVRD